MIVKVMGALDILAAIGIIALHFGLHWWKVPVLIVLYAGVKLVMFHENAQTYIDGVCGLYSIIIFLGFTSVIDYIAAVYLLQKGIMSLAA